MQKLALSKFDLKVSDISEVLGVVSKDLVLVKVRSLNTSVGAYIGKGSPPEDDPRFQVVEVKNAQTRVFIRNNM